MTRDEDTWYLYQWSEGENRWVLKARTTIDSLGAHMFSIRCQQWSHSRIVLMHGDVNVAEYNVYEGNLAYPVMP